MIKALIWLSQQNRSSRNNHLNESVKTLLSGSMTTQVHHQVKAWKGRLMTAGLLGPFL